jgi:hypothetical protein
MVRGTAKAKALVLNVLKAKKVKKMTQPRLEGLPNVRTDYLPGFRRLWASWPAGRKGSMFLAYKKWLQLNLEGQAAAVQGLLGLFKQSPGWKTTKFVPLVVTWLNSQPWLGCDVLEAQAHATRIAQEREQAPQNPLAVKIATARTPQDEAKERNETWGALAPGLRRDIMAQCAADLGTTILCEAAARQWWWKQQVTA